MKERYRLYVASHLEKSSHHVCRLAAASAVVAAAASISLPTMPDCHFPFVSFPLDAPRPQPENDTKKNTTPPVFDIFLGGLLLPPTFSFYFPVQSWDSVFC